MAINIPIFSSLDTKGFDKLKREFSSLESNSEKAAFILKKAMLPAAAAIGAVGTALGAAALAAAEDQKSQAAFETQIRNSIGAMNGQIESLNSYVTATQMATGVSDTLVRQGLGNLIRATRDQTQAQKLMNISMDISAATGKDLESVTIAMGKAATGQISALKKLGIPLDENTVKTKDFEAATQQLADTFGGAAAAQANTFQGRIAQLKERLGEMWEEIGYKVLPILTDLADKIIELVDAFGEGGVGGAIKMFRRQMQGLTRDSDGTLNGLGNFVNALITVRNAIAHVVNVFIRMANVLPFVDDISTIKMVEQLGTNFNDLYGALSKTTLEMEKQKKLEGFMGPVSSRNVQELTANFEAYKEQLRFAVDETENLDTATTKAGGSAKKHTRAVKEQAKAIKDDLANAYEAAVNALKDKFSPALKDANDKLTAAQDIYNGFYSDIRQSVASVGNLGDAWTAATKAQDEYSQALTDRQKAYEALQTAQQGTDTSAIQKALDELAAAERRVTIVNKKPFGFFEQLEEQSGKAKKLAANLETLITNGLDDPTLLQSILAAGTDTGLAISQAIIDGGDEALTQVKNWAKTIGDAADGIAKLTADKWYKSGVDQAQAVVDGINSVIKDTEFALKFAVDPASIAALSAMFDTNVAAVNAGQTPAAMFNPADFSAAAYMALGQPAGTGSTNITVNAGLVSTPQQIGQQIIEAILKAQRANGTTFVVV